MQCNIDAKGKAIRLIYGAVLLIIGVIAIFVWAWPTGTGLSWTISLAMVLSGGFAIFEARAGWCAVRAMGFRTPF